MRLPKIIAIVGPTATGKSDLAVEVAKKVDGEVISADSRQVYKGLDIGSGKVTKREMKGVPHHLLDVEDPKKTYTAERFKRDAEKAIADVQSRGKLPIICGGTGFYIDALVFDESFPAVRPDKRLRATLAKRTPEALMKMIAKLDPRRARELDPRNKVRIIRAIEVARALGKVPKTKRKKRYETLWIGLSADRETLKARIRERLEKRMRRGMVEEARRLRRRGLSWKRFHELGLEYRYLALYLRGVLSKGEMIEQLRSEIAKFSKRQMTWFKRNDEIEWFDIRRAKQAVIRAKRFAS